MSLSDMVGIVSTALLSVAGAGALMVPLAKYFGERAAERWIESVRAGYARELARVQHDLDQLGKKHQAALDHLVSVSRAQFEVEFQVVREIWKRVARARGVALAIVETTVPLDDTQEQKLQRFFAARSAFSEAVRKLLLAVDNNSPFYPPAIYAAVDQFRGVVQLERLRLETHDDVFTVDWYNARDAAKQAIVASADSVSAAIRERLGAIVIQNLPG